jgi:hypothetical protein
MGYRHLVLFIERMLYHDFMAFLVNGFTVLKKRDKTMRFNSGDWGERKGGERGRGEGARKMWRGLNGRVGGESKNGYAQ